MVAHLERPHLQNVAGLLESRQPRPKHHPNPARSRLALEMDRLAPDRFRNLHALLRQKIPAPFKKRIPPAPSERGHRERTCGGLTSAAYADAVVSFCLSALRLFLRRTPDRAGQHQ